MMFIFIYGVDVGNFTTCVHLERIFHSQDSLAIKQMTRPFQKL
jgi:hypothetical protein